VIVKDSLKDIRILLSPRYLTGFVELGYTSIQGYKCDVLKKIIFEVKFFGLPASA
jgi:hypothetical protein